MAAVHGKGAVFSLDDSSGSLRALTSYVNSVSFSRDVDTAETTTFGDDDKEYIVGLRGAELSIEGNYDSAASTGPDTVIPGTLGSATALDWEYGPEGSASGKTKYSGTGFVTAYETSAEIGDKVGFSASIQITGAVTKGTY